MKRKDGKLLMRCLREIWNHEPQSLLMAGGLAVGGCAAAAGSGAALLAVCGGTRCRPVL